MGGLRNLDDELHFEDSDYDPGYSSCDDPFKGYEDNEYDTDDEVEEANRFYDFLNA